MRVLRRGLVLILAVAGLPAKAEPSLLPPAGIAEASAWLTGRWTYEGDIEVPGQGPASILLALEFRPDGTLETTQEITLADASAPDAALGGRLTAGWRLESVGATGLRVALEDALMSRGEEEPRPPDPPIEAMIFTVEPDGTLLDADLGVPWRR